jgi:hypothetical protein
VSTSRYVRITIGKHERRIYFNHAAIADLEKEAGAGISQLFRQEQSFHAARLLLWAGLKHEDRGLTLQRADMLIDAYLKPTDEGGNGGTIETLTEKLMEGIAVSGLFKGMTKASDEAEIDGEFEPPPPADAPDESLGEATATS